MIYNSNMNKTKGVYLMMVKTECPECSNHNTNTRMIKNWNGNAIVVCDSCKKSYAIEWNAEIHVSVSKIEFKKDKTSKFFV